VLTVTGQRSQRPRTPTGNQFACFWRKSGSTDSSAERAGRFQHSFPCCGFEQFDRVTCGVVEQDLVAAEAADNIVPEVGSCLPQSLDFVARSRTSSWIRFQPPGSGLRPSGMG
jgi:hypothetical protein